MRFGSVVILIHVASVDPRTLLVVANFCGLLCALVLWVQARSFPTEIGGIKPFSFGVVLIGCASGLASTRGLWPDFVSIVLSSAAVLLGQFLLIVALQQYAGRQPAYRPALDGIGAVVLVVVWLTYGVTHYQGRILVIGLAQIVLSGIAGYLAWRAQPRGFGSRFLTGLFIVSALIAAWRIGTLPTHATEPDDIFDHNLVQQIYLSVFSLGILALSIGFIVLTNERLRLELEFMATRDPMTGALNRRAFFVQGQIEWARSQRNARALAVIVSDIDFFKKVNDTYGHQVGDQVIIDFSSRTQSMLRPHDVLARFGGEEFVVLLPETSVSDAIKVAERIRREIEKQRRSGLPPYTVSIGVATSDAHAPDLETLIAKADEALYRAKEGGRNRVES